jgi:hypothetical protein
MRLVRRRDWRRTDASSWLALSGLFRSAGRGNRRECKMTRGAYRTKAAEGSFGDLIARYRKRKSVDWGPSTTKKNDKILAEFYAANHRQMVADLRRGDFIAMRDSMIFRHMKSGWSGNMESDDLPSELDADYPNPTDADLASPEFEAIWQAIKKWDVSRIDRQPRLYSGATGSDVMHILHALRSVASADPA